MIKRFVIFIFIVLVISIAGCDSNRINTIKSAKDEQFYRMFPEIEFSKKLELIPSINSQGIFFAGQEISLKVVNHTFRKINIVLDEEIYCLTYQQGDWIYVKDIITYLNQPANYYLSPAGGWGSNRPIEYFPDLSQYPKPVDIRIAVIGKIVRNGQDTDEKIGSFIDITVLP
jgi:hypothetical protein